MHRQRAASMPRGRDRGGTREDNSANQIGARDKTVPSEPEPRSSGAVQRKQCTGSVRLVCRGAAIGEERVKTILQIIEEAGGFPKAEGVSIDNEPWVRVVIEVPPERGPDGHVVVSVAHYGEQNSDAMRDPEMLFEVVNG